MQTHHYSAPPNDDGAHPWRRPVYASLIHPMKSWRILSGLLWALLCLLGPGLPAAALNPAQPLRQYGQQLWQTDNGLTQNTVHAIRQTRDGYLWLATDGGLVRFDGADFTVFDRHSAPAMRSNLIAALEETADGALWAATADGLLRRSQGGLRAFGVADGLPAGRVTGVFAADAGHLWALAPDAVYYGSASASGEHFARVAGMDAPLTNAEGAPIATPDGRGNLWVATAHSASLLREGRVAASLPATAELLTADAGGALWLATATGLLRYEHGALTPVPIHNTHASPLETQVRAMATDRHGRTFIATAHALGVLEGNALLWKTKADGLPAGRILRLYADHRGALWIFTEDAIARYVAGRFETLRPASPGRSVEDVYEDSEGSLWLGTDGGGMLQLHAQRFSTLTSADGLPGDAVRTLLAGTDGTLWAGTDGGGVARQSGSTWQQFTTRSGLISNSILSLAQQRDGALLVGTPDGLDRLEAAHSAAAAFQPESADTLPDDFIRSLLADPHDGSLWIGTRRGLAHRSPGSMQTWTHSDGLGSDLVGALELDRQHGDGLWIGTRGGLSHMEHGRLTTITTRDGLASDVITALFQDADGALWIGTNGGGLNLLRDGRAFAFPSSTGLPEVIHSILEDGRGDLWLGSTTGIYRASRRELEAYRGNSAAQLTVAAYGVADGMRIAECSSGHPASARTPDGELWFATLRGISVTDPERTEENRVPPPVAIENVTIDDQPVAFDSALRIAAGHNRIALHYAALSFVAPARVRYRYRLVGFDLNWIDASTRRSADYTNIPPGRYSFQVLAANNDGIWSQSAASLDIRVLPHLYQTWCLRALLLLLTAALAYQLYRMRVRSVESRYAAVLAERTRIAREIHDTLAQDIVGISVQLELVSRLLGSSVDAARTQLDAARSLVKSSLAEARSSIWNLRSATGGADDLPTRMNKALTQAAGLGTARLAFAVKGTYRPAPRPLEDELLRIAQEAVTNAVRHAEATRIDATLDYDTRAVELAVEDDGRGFLRQPTLSANGHYGLKGMEERAQQIGGVLQVDSSAGKGTRISLHVEIP
jgi:ligand-binding sensor domain-containing protein/signal transduction histidine kinase